MMKPGKVKYIAPLVHVGKQLYYLVGINNTWINCNNYLFTMGIVWLIPITNFLHN